MLWSANKLYSQIIITQVKINEVKIVFLSWWNNPPFLLRRSFSLCKNNMRSIVRSRSFDLKYKMIADALNLEFSITNWVQSPELPSIKYFRLDRNLWILHSRS